MIPMSTMHAGAFRKFKFPSLAGTSTFNSLDPMASTSNGGAVISWTSTAVAPHEGLILNGISAELIFDVCFTATSSTTYRRVSMWWVPSPPEETPNVQFYWGGEVLTGRNFWHIWLLDDTGSSPNFEYNWHGRGANNDIPDITVAPSKIILGAITSRANALYTSDYPVIDSYSLNDDNSVGNSSSWLASGSPVISWSGSYSYGAMAALSVGPKPITSFVMKDTGGGSNEPPQGYFTFSAAGPIGQSRLYFSRSFGTSSADLDADGNNISEKVEKIKEYSGFATVNVEGGSRIPLSAVRTNNPTQGVQSLWIDSNRPVYARSAETRYVFTFYRGVS